MLPGRIVATALLAFAFENKSMTTFFYSTLLLLTIAAAFAFGVAAGYWVICGFLNLFNPSKPQSKPAPAPSLAPTGD